MSWWEKVYENIHLGDMLETPGKGIEGVGKGKYEVKEKHIDRIIIRSGRQKIPLEKSFFDVTEKFFCENQYDGLRVVAAHANEPFDNSVDKLIRKFTGSNWARGNYICSLLENNGLVHYVMQGNKKYIYLKEKI